jgi:FtsZ-binding cell division protein ZapB
MEAERQNRIRENADAHQAYLAQRSGQRPPSNATVAANAQALPARTQQRTGMAAQHTTFTAVPQQYQMHDPYIQHLQHENNRLQQDSSRAQQEIGHLQQENNHLYQEIGHIQGEMTRYQQDARRRRDENNSLKQVNHQLKMENHNLKHQGTQQGSTQIVDTPRQSTMATRNQPSQTADSSRRVYLQPTRSMDVAPQMQQSDRHSRKRELDDETSTHSPRRMKREE